ncbi:MAG: hypothetical protein SVU88_00865 [Candidatus Nanohaloarchaea archaeon]|nr:hypothetical protein [Candidatus Nanohaloarchaea archaeon]
MYDVGCTRCDWTGGIETLDGEDCPMCGGTVVDLRECPSCTPGPSVPARPAVWKT